MARRSFVVLAGALALAAITAVADVPSTAKPVAAQTAPAPNPPIAEQCGLPVTLVLDASGSIQSSNAVETVRDAAEVFLDAVKDTGSTARVVDFGTFSRQTAPAELVTTASMLPSGVHGQAVASYYNPRPPLTAPATAARQYDGSGALSNTGNFGGLDNGNTQWTNWDSALDRAGVDAGELVVFVTDGDPTAIDLDQPGDAFNPPGTTVAFNTFRGEGTGPSVDRAVQEANTIKTGGARILAVGVGAAVTQPASVQRLTQIAGPQVVTDTSTVTGLNQVDVAVVPDFDDLSDLLRSVVTELCSPSLTIRKFAQSAGSAGYAPAPGWSMSVAPTVTGGTFNWILPDTTPAASKTVVTNADGLAQFQWEPVPPTASSSAAVSEVVQPGYTAGPAACEILGPTGTATFLEFPSAAAFTVPVGPQDIVRCAMRNDFNYAPAITLVKTPSDVLVRGDDGGTAVTYTYVVTNTGNTPLVLSDGDDDECADVELVSGDEEGDGILGIGESWTYQCTRTLQSELTQEEVFSPNTASITGVDPEGTEVEATDDATVEIITPAINLEKVPSATLVPPGTPVTYTFTVTNLGNDPLSAITLTDDQCGTPTFVSGDINGNTLLDLTETWTYTCAAVIVDDPTINQATVTGTPTEGPTVSDPANAEVDVVYEDMNLDKTPSSNEVLVGDEVTYTYVVSNPAADPLTPIAPTTRADLVTDDTCAPVTYVTGDTDDDSILSEDEAWTYTCTAVITATTLNTASATMQGPLGPISREDPAIVIPLPAGIEIVKTASDDLVPAGSDVTYSYEVRNTALAPLAGVIPSGVEDDFCSPVTYVEGDTDGDGLLDRGEVFIFTCTATLTEDTTNTATVTGVPTLPDGSTGPPVTADDPATVDVFTPGIELVKTVSAPLVRVDTPVTYTFVGTNTGDIELTPLGIVDDQCAPLTFISGDPEDDGKMAPGEAWTWECTKTAVVGTTNTAVIEAVDPTGEPVTDDDDAVVDVFDSEIRIVKSVNPVLVAPGATTTFTFTVTNPGTAPLTNVTVTDDRCSPLTFTGGDTNGDSALAPAEAETWTYTCSRAISEFTLNTGTATGTDPGGFNPTDSDPAAALPYAPGIAVVKTATPTQVASGGSVTYRYVVTNTGDIPLGDVKERITDDTCSPVTYVSGDDDGNGLLTGGIALFEISAEIWVFECTTTVTRDTTNTVTATGVPTIPGVGPIGPAVSANAVATVDVIGRLPATGSDAWRIVRLGLLIGGTGVALVVVAWMARRRRQRPAGA